MTKEIWVPIKGFEDSAEVSNLGRVRSLTRLCEHGGYRPRLIKGRYYKCKPKKDGYAKVTLWDKKGNRVGYRVHVLVALHFVVNPKPKVYKIARHLNDIRSDNKASNLAWGTRKHNARDAQRNNKLGNKLTYNEVKALKRDFIKYKHKFHKKIGGGLFKPLAVKYGVGIHTVHQIYSGKRWNHVH